MARETGKTMILCGVRSLSRPYLASLSVSRSCSRARPPHSSSVTPQRRHRQPSVKLKADSKDGDFSALASEMSASSKSAPKRIMSKLTEPVRPLKAPDVPNLSSPAAMGAQTTHEGVDLHNFLVFLGWHSLDRKCENVYTLQIFTSTFKDLDVVPHSR